MNNQEENKIYNNIIKIFLLVFVVLAAIGLWGYISLLKQLPPSTFLGQITEMNCHPAKHTDEGTFTNCVAIEPELEEIYDIKIIRTKR